MKFYSEDNGNCRVYYSNGINLYCWQDDGSWGRHDWKFYVCSHDGEPSHLASWNAGLEVPLPPGQTSIGRELIAFLAVRS